MGISITYSLTLSRAEDINGVLAAARTFALESGWRVQPLDAGLLLDPGNECEAIVLSPGPDGLIADSLKTQFSGPTVHVQVVSLLDRLRPLVASLEVEDDSDYWQARDLSLLQQAFESEAALIGAARQRLADRPVLRVISYWLRVVGLCAVVFLAVVAVVLAALWLKARIGA